MADPERYRALAESSWAWVLSQVRRDDGDVWLPEHPAQTEPGDYPYGMHSGVGGLAHAMSEIRLTRDLTAEETALGGEIAGTLVHRIPDTTEYDYFDGLVSTLGALIALDAPGADLAVARLRALATPDGWQTSWLAPPAPCPKGAATTPPSAPRACCSVRSGPSGTTCRARPNSWTTPSTW